MLIKNINHPNYFKKDEKPVEAAPKPTPVSVSEPVPVVEEVIKAPKSKPKKFSSFGKKKLH